MKKTFKLNPKVASFSDATMGISFPNTNPTVEIELAQMTHTTAQAIKHGILIEVELPEEAKEPEETEAKTEEVTTTTEEVKEEAETEEEQGEPEEEEFSRSEMLEMLKDALSKDEYKKINKASNEEVLEAFRKLPS